VAFAGVARQECFSQFGEDAFLRDYFGDRKGLYIDIGGNHPFRLSNTYLLYKRGWSGLVVEPIYRLYAKHRRFRRRDIQVNAAAGNEKGELTFYEMVPSVLSTCNAEEAERLLSSGVAKLLRTYSVPVLTVASLHQDYLGGRHVSLLSVDTEGHDMPVLEGVDWRSMRPEVIICEANDENAVSAVSGLLSLHGYECQARLGCNILFSHG
jgi:FkbM family methyltransferase